MNYLIPEFTGMGDVIQQTPMIRAIHSIDKNAQIFIIGDNRWQGLNLIKDSDLITETYNVLERLGLVLPDHYTNSDISDLYKKITRKEHDKVSSWLQNANIDVFLQPQHCDVPEFVLSLISKVDCCTVYRHVDINDVEESKLLDRWKKKKKSVYVPVLKGRHDIDSHYDLLEAMVIKPFSRRYETWISLPGDQVVLDRWQLSKKKYICLQPGAANGAPTPKVWDPQNFVALAGELMNQAGTTVVLLGDRGDQESIISSYDWPSGVINTAGETTIDELVALLKNASSVIAHDSGIMHLANAIGVPLIALYGPTDFTATKPLGESSTILYSKTEAFAAMYRSTASEKKLAEKYPNYSAMAGITVSDVMQVVKKLL